MAVDRTQMADVESAAKFPNAKVQSLHRGQGHWEHAVNSSKIAVSLQGIVFVAKVSILNSFQRKRTNLRVMKQLLDLMLWLGVAKIASPSEEKEERGFVEMTKKKGKNPQQETPE